MASTNFEAGAEDPYKGSRDTRGLIFSYAGPKQLQQARMEAIQLRIKERLNTTLLKNKDNGYAGLETCEHGHDDLGRGASGYPTASIFPKPKDLEGSIEQFCSLVVPPVLSKRGEELSSSAKLVVDGRPGAFQQTIKLPHKFGHFKNVNTAFHVDGEDAEAEAEKEGEEEPGREATRHIGRAPPPKGKGSSRHAPKKPKHAAQSRGSVAGLRDTGASSTDAEAAAPAGPTAKGASVSASVGEGGSQKAKHKVDAKLVKTLNGSVAAPYVPVVIGSDVVPSRGMSTTAGVIGAVRKSVVENGAIMRSLTTHVANTLETRMVKSGQPAAGGRERMSYVGGADIKVPLSVGAKQALAEVEEEARSSVPLVKVEEVDIVQESKRKASASLLRQHGTMQRRGSGNHLHMCRDGPANAPKTEPNQFEPIDPATLAQSSQAAVAMLLRGLLPPEMQQAIPGFEKKKQALPSQNGGCQLSLQSWQAQTLKQRQNEGRAGDAGWVSLQQQQQQQQGQADQQQREQQALQRQQPAAQEQLHKQDHLQMAGASADMAQPSPAPPQPAHSSPPHCSPSQPCATARGYSSTAELHGLQETLPPQRPWLPATPPHARVQPHMDPPAFPLATRQASKTTSPSRSPTPPRPPWHLASAQLPPKRPRSSQSSPHSHQASPPHRHRPASPAPSSPSPSAQPLPACAPAPPSPSSPYAPPAASLRPHTAISEHATASCHGPASPAPRAPRPASANTRPPWRTSSPRPYSAAPTGFGAPRSPAHSTQAALGSADEDSCWPMYDWQYTGGPTHRHAIPTSYQQHAFQAGTECSSWGSFATEPVPASLPWPPHPTLSAAAAVAKHKRPQSAPSYSHQLGATPTPMAGVHPPSSDTRIALIRQQQAVVPSPKTANRERDPAHALARATQSPLNSTPRFPFSPPPGAPSNVYPCPQPWAAASAPGSVSPSTHAAALPRPASTSHGGAAGPSQAAPIQIRASLGQASPTAGSGGDGCVHSGRPVSACPVWQADKQGGIIRGVPAAMQTLELPARLEHSWVYSSGEAPAGASRSPYKSRPLSARPAYCNLRHNPGAQRPLSASPLLALERPTPPKDGTLLVQAAANALPRSPLPRPHSGGPSSPALLQCSSAAGSAGAHASGTGSDGRSNAAGITAASRLAGLGGVPLGRPKSALVLSPSGVPSRRARPPSAGMWGSSGGSDCHSSKREEAP